MIRLKSLEDAELLIAQLESLTEEYPTATNQLYLEYWRAFSKRLESEGSELQAKPRAR